MEQTTIRLRSGTNAQLGTGANLLLGEPGWITDQSRLVVGNDGNVAATRVAMLPDLDNKVNITTTINGKPLSGNVVLNSLDVGAPRLLVNDEDLNDITTPGNYACSSAVAARIVNKPDASIPAFGLTVVQTTQTNNYVYQELIPYTVSSSVVLKKYWRKKVTVQGTWSDWYSDLTTAETVSIAQGGTGATTQQSAARALAVPSLLRSTENQLAQGADLNTVTAVGNYFVPTSAIANSIQNSPYTTSVFKLIVEEGTAAGATSTNGLIQTIITPGLSSNPGFPIYRRTLAPNGSGGSTWQKYEGLPANSLKSIASAYYLGGGETAIPVNGDLDTYTTPGQYVVNANSTAITIVNKPTNLVIAFKLTVENMLNNAAGNYLLQKIESYRGETWVRRRQHTTDEWQAWEFKPKMQYGSESRAIAANTDWTSYTVNFGYAFSAVPNMFIQLVGSTNANDEVSVWVSASNATTFTYQIRNTAAGSRTVFVRWLAVGI